MNVFSKEWSVLKVIRLMLLTFVSIPLSLLALFLLFNDKVGWACIALFVAMMINKFTSYLRKKENEKKYQTNKN